MSATACHAEAEPVRDQVKTLILKTLGVERVAGWCSVEASTVYQWLSRGSDQEPIPPRYVPSIITGARSEGFVVDAGMLWPAMRGIA